MIKEIIYVSIISLVITLLVVTGLYYFIPYEIDPIGMEDELGATITTINGSDKIKDSRAVINTNFANLNSDKLEVSDFLATTSLPQITTLSNLISIGTITTGTWASTDIGVPYGGTGASSFAKYHILMGNGSDALTVVATGTEDQVLTIVGGVPTWDSATVNETLDYSWTGEHDWSATTTFNGATFGIDYGIFGDGSDGASTTAGNFTMTRDMYFTDLTINSGITLKTGGYRLYIKNNLTNNGTIDNSGTSASGITAGTGGATGSLLGGGAGGAGATVNASSGGGGGGGGVLFVFANNVIKQGALTANGGNGGNAVGTGSNGGSGGFNTGTNVANGIVASNGGTGGTGGGSNPGVVSNVRSITEQSVLIINNFIDPKNLVALGGGAGGGSGLVSNAIAGAYGGGGGGGGTILFVYRTLQTAGTTSVSGGSAGTTTVVSPVVVPTAGTDGKVVTINL